MRVRLIISAVLLLFSVGGCFLSTDLSQRYYARELAQVHASEHVQVDGVEYDVVGANVSEGGKPVTGILAWRPRKLAYETQLARLDPFFEIAGTDPENLRAQLPLLEETEQAYARMQKTEASSSAMYSLYPIALLSELATLEDERQALMAEPTEANAQAYGSELAQVSTRKLHSIDSFESAFESAVSPTFHYYIFSGEVTYQSYVATLDSFRKDAEATQGQLAARSDCLNGWYFSCADDLQMPFFATTSAPEPPQSIERAVAAVWKDAESGSEAADDPVVVQLAQSACLSALGPPYDITSQFQRTTTGTVFELSDADAIFFLPTNSGNAPFLTYVRTELGMAYTSESPVKSYTCGQIGPDIGTTLAVREIAAFANSHPDIAPAQRAALLQSSVLSEYAAQDYLDSALSQETNAPTSSDLHQLEELALMEKGKAAGLDSIVEDIWHVATIDTDPQLSLIDTSVQTTFATHAAFPTMFLIGSENPDILAGLYAATSSVQTILLPTLVPLEKLRTETPYSNIVHDLRELLIFEGRYATSTPSTIPSTTSPASSGTLP